MRVRLILSFIIVIVITILSMIVIVRTTTAREVNTFMMRGGMAGVDEIASSLEEYYSDNRTWDGAQRSVLGMSSMMGGQGRGMHGGIDQRLVLADSSGAIVFDTANPAASSTLSPEELGRAIPLYSSGQVAGYLLAEGGMNAIPGVQTNLLTRLNRAALVAAGIAGAISLVLALMLSYTLLRPIHDLTKAASSLETGDLSHRVPVRGSDELATLGRGFNRMADSLQQSEESRRAMTADIAHELRNPLAVQRAQLEALQDGIYPLTAENLAPLLEQNNLLNRLVEDLRTLALADAGQLELEKTSVDLKTLVDRVVEQFQQQAAARRITLSIEPTGDQPRPFADPTRIEQILGNLLGNALRYTPEGGLITVGIAVRPVAAQVTVRDSGTGLPAGTLERVFERFFRADKSRSRDEGGTGLGLAIARQLARAHGGDLTAANHPQGGAVFTLSLPVE